MKLHKALQPSFIKRMYYMRFLGKFTKAEKEKSGENFFVQCLSPIPFTLQEQFTNEPYVFEGLCSNKKNEKIFSELKKRKLEKQLVMFRLYYERGNVYVELICTEEPNEIASSYKMIPAPKVTNNKKRESLERKLSNGYLSFLMPKFPKDFEPPELLWHDGRLYGNISLKSSISSIAYFEQKRECKYINCSDWTKYVEIAVEDQLYFVSDYVYEQLKKRMHEEGKLVEVEDIKVQKDEWEWDERESSFLQYVQSMVHNKGLYLDETDIYNFHISVKTNMLTILGGIPGVGKSRFVQTYAEALGLQYGEELVWIPISPSYQEPHDLLGYLHPNGTFIESETKLVRTLMKAKENPNQLYIIVFDEMNMSHIEHWFTPFLSVLELETKNRILNLYEGVQDIENSIPSTIEIGENIIFVGTVNFDETTKELSDRLLDRTNLITLQKIPFCEMDMEQGKVVLHPPLKVTAGEFRINWMRNKAMIEVFSEEELELLDKLHVVLSSHDASKGISFRCANAIATYLQNIPFQNNHTYMISREEGFDLQIKQRVLTKIRGTEMMVGPLLSEEAKRGATLVPLLQSALANRVSTFEHSLAYIREKRRELELYGYAK
ncbi:TPA: AAA family ATPase [Bacillus cereus]|uniref:AAA family ATPase n=1 Tax=Bacillus TaxID=1386 RepID=UPI00032F894A|nr:AAA family ATPase [Bacillus cereus]EKS8358721.1 AAA family ATPase [Bacillus cereus]MCU7389488.1 AAA family ATPase [Bacillus sp. ST24]MDA2605260.1 AAA family ATPase [Bacillus cereus]HEF7291424.1 AAA family ATPase [Bacillus cereus]